MAMATAIPTPVDRPVPTRPEALARGWSEQGDDCDDADPTVYEGAFEACDGRDNDCDGEVDGQIATTPDERSYTSVDEGITAAIASGQRLSVCEGRHEVLPVNVPFGASLEIRGVGRQFTTLVGVVGAATLTVQGSLSLGELAVVGPPAGAGLVVRGRGQSEVQDALFHESAVGVRLSDDAVATFVDTDFVSNGQGGSGHGGLHSSGRITLTVTRGTFQSNEGWLGGGLAHSADGGWSERPR